MIREEDTIAWKRYNPNMEKSIFIGIYNVRLDTFPAYKKNSVLHSPCGEQEQHKAAARCGSLLF